MTGRSHEEAQLALECLKLALHHSPKDTDTKTVLDVSARFAAFVIGGQPAISREAIDAIIDAITFVTENATDEADVKRIITAHVRGFARK